MYTFNQILKAIQNGEVTNSIEDQMRREIQEAEQKRITELFKPTNKDEN